MDLKLAVLLIASAQFCVALPSFGICNCPRRLAPVCGSDGQTYNNQCLFDCAKHTARQDLTIVKLSPCEDYNNSGICGCSLEYMPVCGNDDRTYPNICHIGCESQSKPNLRVAYEGECKWLPQINVPMPAPMPSQPNTCFCNDLSVSRPVCGSDGITYGNDCLLNCATAHNSRLSIAYYSACTEDFVLDESFLRDAKPADAE